MTPKGWQEPLENKDDYSKPLSKANSIKAENTHLITVPVYCLKKGRVKWGQMRMVQGACAVSEIPPPTSVEVASQRPLVKSSYSSKCSYNPSGIILTRILYLAPAWCTGSVCILIHW